VTFAIRPFDLRSDVTYEKGSRQVWASFTAFHTWVKGGNGTGGSTGSHRSSDRDGQTDDSSDVATDGGGGRGTNIGTGRPTGNTGLLFSHQERTSGPTIAAPLPTVNFYSDPRWHKKLRVRLSAAYGRA